MAGCHGHDARAGPLRLVLTDVSPRIYQRSCTHELDSMAGLPMRIVRCELPKVTKQIREAILDWQHPTT